MHIMAIDQSTTCTGISIFETSKKELIFSSAYKPKGVNSYRKSYEVAKELIKLIEEYKIDILVLEDIWYQPKSVISDNTNRSNVNTHKVLGALLGMVVMSSMIAGIKYEIISATTWKSYHGLLKGRPSSKVQKSRAIDLVNEKYNIKDLVEDQAEAVLIGSFYIDNLKKN